MEMQVISVKFPADLIQAIREEAQRAGEAYTVMIRNAALAELQRRRKNEKIQFNSLETGKP